MNEESALVNICEELLAMLYPFVESLDPKKREEMFFIQAQVQQKKVALSFQRIKNEELK